MKALTIDSKNLTINSLAKLAREGPILLTKNGKIRYAFIKVDDFDVEAYLLGKNLDFIAYLESCRKRARKEGYTSIKNLRKKLELQTKNYTLKVI